MLRELRIRNFAIIDDLTIEFREGLNVITGETGAGKSIIIEALSLVRGDRAVAQLREELAALDREVADAGHSERDAEEKVERLAEELSLRRRRAAGQLEKAMRTELAAIGMNQASFEVRFESSDSPEQRLGPTGIDRISFHLSANRGEPPKPLVRIASGGELSRIMLALKTLTASVVETPILIFDEVDVGIGGTVADAVARRLKKLASTRQLFCITHLPQIAAYADHHFAVEKHVEGDRTVAHARPLGDRERVRELSRMLGGSVAPNEAERYAQRLIRRAHCGDAA
jgi:DNA repair protein RecN (Recombination protein N)